MIYFSLTLNIACLNDPVIIFMFYTSNRFMMKPGTMFPVFSIDVGLSGAEDDSPGVSLKLIVTLLPILRSGARWERQ